MKKVGVFLADGCEEVEALTVVDLLRRAGLQVIMISIMKSKMIISSHQVKIEADVLFEENDFNQLDAIVLPGGMPGTLNLDKHAGVRKIVQDFYKENKLVAAICAGPSVLGHIGILKGKRATCFPGVEKELAGATCTGMPVEQSGNVITGRAMGSAIEFSLKIILELMDEETENKVRKSIVY